MSALIDPDAWYTTAEVAALIRTSDEYVARQCSAGHMQAKKVGSWRIRGSAVIDFMSGTGSAPAARKREKKSARQMRRSA